MRWSIRSQILIPLVGIQVLAVAVIASTTARLATDRSEREIIARLNSVIGTLEDARFPYTAGVLAKMRGLSGAHFALVAADGTLESATLPALRALPGSLRNLEPRQHLGTLAEAPLCWVDDMRYFAAPLRVAGGLHPATMIVLYPETSWRQARWEAATPPLAMGLGTLGLMAGVTGWIAHRISGRVRALQRQVARIAAGDFERFEPGPRRDEVQELASSINSLCSQLKGMQQTIRQSERTRLLAQFAAGLAHQLRNSLTGARLSVQLHAKRFPPPAGDETLTVALRQLAMTEEQVRGLLSLGRIERRPHVACDLGRLLGEVAELVNPSCQHARVVLRHRPDDRPVLVMGDEAGLRAAVLNLAMNAIEAAGPGGLVRLRTATRGDEVDVEVADTGPGPPPTVAEHLLEPFVTGKPEGVGLGLAVAQQVAGEHGGRLAWSRRDGATLFSLSLPGVIEPAARVPES